MEIYAGNLYIDDRVSLNESKQFVCVYVDFSKYNHFLMYMHVFSVFIYLYICILVKSRKQVRFF